MGRLKFILILLIASALNAAGQDCGTAFLGTKTLYIAPIKKEPKAPAGYRAVFINYVGRHGARHLTKEVSTSFAYHVFNKADSSDLLTADGKRLHQMILNLNKVEHGRVKNISAEGAAELKGLGERMVESHPEVFKKPVKLEIAYTKEIRTIQSAEAFITGLKSELNDSVTIRQFNDDVNLRFYDLSSAYTAFEEKGPWISRMDSLKNDLHIDVLQQHIIARWFKPAFLQKLEVAQAERLIGDVFGFAAIAYSLNTEAKMEGLEPSSINFSALFTCDELKALGRLDDADDYYKKAPGFDNNGIQVRIAAPLLADFIRTTDNFINKPTVNAQLRFAHAETIAPFAALLDINVASKKTLKAKDFEKNWKAGDIIPLSSNIRWVVYKKNNLYLVQCLLNEKPVNINGLKAIATYFYNWKELRKYYLAKLESLGLSLNSDMKKYLTETK
ncbi:histidine-type phosphatase [Mucilaginibacter sp. KACC 22063]|uniref:histidine-type phosphatase n=1 Tax=Mucilaginibacter sp. KACC 22063 TaxID=3025666 RepID=UPI002365627A|nr:histidine-type phosphatase [Mucilaginibacter sp. KACC 22063]WDF55187.1 histidine-type phosphatase [Mucilaginibacter sp. KACC 22063]